MEEINQDIEDAVKELKETSDDQLRETIEKWFESTKTDGMKIGAYYISAGVYAAIRKNLNKNGKPSLNDYRRCIKDITKIIETQLKTDITKQNNSEENKNDSSRMDG